MTTAALDIFRQLAFTVRNIIAGGERVVNHGAWHLLFYYLPSKKSSHGLDAQETEPPENDNYFPLKLQGVSSFSTRRANDALIVVVQIITGILLIPTIERLDVRKDKGVDNDR